MNINKIALAEEQRSRARDTKCITQRTLSQLGYIDGIILDCGCGYGFWTNEYGLLWPDLPKETFVASGAGRNLIWMCPERDLVVVQGPGIYEKHDDELCNHVLLSVYRAIVG